MDNKLFQHPGQILREDRLGLFTRSPFPSVHFHWTTTNSPGLVKRAEYPKGHGTANMVLATFAETNSLF